MKATTVVKRLAFAAFITFGGLGAAVAQDEASASFTTDRAAIHSVIRAQFLAFRADDADRAFSLTSPALQRHFLNPELFLEMFKLAYPAVYRPRAFHFDALELSEDRATQKVVILGDGEFALLAVFELQKQSDGRWLISACDLFASGSRVI